MIKITGNDLIIENLFQSKIFIILFHPTPLGENSTLSFEVLQHQDRRSLNMFSKILKS